MPKITVVIATMNVEGIIQETLDSIIAQTFTDFEIIIVDGGSTDGTLEILAAYESHVSRIIQGPDEGIYDAWNKATQFVNSDWVQYLGAGDILANKDVYQNIVGYLDMAKDDRTIVYGNLELISNNTGKKFEFVSISPDDIASKLVDGRPVTPVHPETFSHIRAIKKFGFDKTYRFAADFKFMLQAFNEKPPLHVDLTITHMLVGGMTTQKKNLLDIYLEQQRVMRELNIKIPKIYAIPYYFYLRMKYVICKHLSPKALRNLTNLKRILIGKNSY